MENFFFYEAQDFEVAQTPVSLSIISSERNASLATSLSGCRRRSIILTIPES